jgi:hypothetical protein
MRRDIVEVAIAIVLLLQAWLAMLCDELMVAPAAMLQWRGGLICYPRPGDDCSSTRMCGGSDQIAPVLSILGDLIPKSERVIRLCPVL